MNSFLTFLELGFRHIADIRGYDHMLFIITLCAVYKPSQWKKVLVLVTAFTIGHSITLVLSALDILRLPAVVVETMIPVTIFLTAIHNVLWHRDSNSTFGSQDRIHYSLAMLFGFIHGMGFSNYFRALLGSESDIVLPLFAFNVGLEIGQILIVTIFFSVYYIALRFLKGNPDVWTIFISGAGAGISLVMIINRLVGG